MIHLCCCCLQLAGANLYIFREERKGKKWWKNFFCPLLRYSQKWKRKSDLYKNYILLEFLHRIEKSSRAWWVKVELYYWLHTHLWKFSFSIQFSFFLPFSFKCKFPFQLLLQKKEHQRHRARCNRLTYADEIFTVYEDIKKVKLSYGSNKIFLLCHQIHLRLSSFCKLFN